MWDKRGTGLSERLPADRLPTLEERMDDMRVVMDAAGSERAVALGISEGASLSTVFAATHPDRVASLVLIGGFARMQRTRTTRGARPRRRSESFNRRIGRDMGRQRRAPQAVGADRRRRPRRPGALESHDGVRRHAPATAAAWLEMVRDTDVRATLPAIKVPTLVLHRTDDRDRPGRARPLPGRAHPGRPLRRAARLRPPLVDRRRRPPRRDRSLSHRQHHRLRAGPRARHGDVHRHRRLHHASRGAGRPALAGSVDAHDRTVRSLLRRYRGREVKTLGDGFLATFDGPGRAIRCAASCATRCARSASRCAPASTRARSSWPATTSPGSP